MNTKIVETMFPGTLEKIKQKKCPMCHKDIGIFRDRLSEKEYGISGMCQECQDKIYGGID